MPAPSDAGMGLAALQGRVPLDVAPELSVRCALRQMHRARADCVVVLDTASRRALGILTLRDVLARVVLADEVLAKQQAQRQSACRKGRPLVQTLARADGNARRILGKVIKRHPLAVDEIGTVLLRDNHRRIIVIFVFDIANDHFNNVFK